MSDKRMKDKVIVNTEGIVMAISVSPFSTTTYYYAPQESSSFPHCLYALIGLNDTTAQFDMELKDLLNISENLDCWDLR